MQSAPQQQPSRQGTPAARQQMAVALPTPFGLMRRLFDDIASLAMPDIPRVDVTKRADDILVEVDLPGMTPENVRLTIDDDHMVLEGERRSEREVHEGDVYASERAYGRFRRTIPLPVRVDPSKAKARLEEGVL